MVSRSLVIGIGILILVGLGFLIVSTMTGNVITGSVVNDEVVENKYFRIDDFSSENEINKEVENGEDSSRSG